MYNLAVVSIVSRQCAEEPQVKAVNDILQYHGYRHIQHIDDVWIGFVSKLLHYIDVCKELTDFTHLMLMDARDVVVLAGPDEVMERYFAFNHPWVYNAEPFIWSPGSFQPEDYPPCDTPYRYMNAGVCIGERDHMAQHFAKWTSGGVGYPKTDQDWMAARYLEGYPDAIKLDNNCELFQCMCGSQVGENPIVTVTPGRVYNRVTGTNPIIIHFNGGTNITDPDRSFLWNHWI